MRARSEAGVFDGIRDLGGRQNAGHLGIVRNALETRQAVLRSQGV
jgi:hypothetical protein